MIIELTEDIQVRVPEEKLPLGTKQSVFHTFKVGTKGNYSSENRDGTHRVHRFSANAGKYGILTFVCVTELRDPPSWL
jgi:hypothetical protein